MTKTFEITAGAIQSIYEAETAEAAILAYVNDSGYATVEDAAKALNQSADEFLADITAIEIK